MLTSVSSASIIDVTGNAATATKLKTARTIAGKAFDGTTDVAIGFIDLSAHPSTIPGYGITIAASDVPTLNQDTTGTAAKATKLATARTIAGQTFDGSANISIGFTDLSAHPSTIAEYGIIDAASGSVATSRKIDTGAGLSGGGDLSADRTISITNSITTGTLIGSSSVVPVISYNAQGMLTAVSTATITANTIGAAPIVHTQPWNTVTGTPTTLTGFGITDALPLSGGSMSGALLLNAAPTLDLHASTKKYVDDSVVGAVQYKGTVNITATPPVSPKQGALYRVATGGAPNAGYSFSVSTVDVGDYVVYNSTNWDRLANVNPTVSGVNGVTVTPTGDTAYQVGITNSITSGASIGSSSVVPVISYNTQGLLTTVTTATITPSTIGAVPVSGGSMSGLLIASGDPTVTLGVATKQYVDNATVNGVTSSRNVQTGAGLSGGGNLTADRTIYITNSITTGTLIGSSSVVPVISYNAQGMLTAVSTATITASSISAAPATRSVSSGTGLSGGGDLSADRTLSIANTGVSGSTAGSTSVVPVIGYNLQGQLTSVTTATITPSTIGALPVSGGSMSGALILNADPTLPLGSATKQYVDGKTNNALPGTTALTAGTGIGVTNGGTLSGGVTVSISNSGVSGSVAGSASVVPVIGYNLQGQLTSVSSATITASGIGAIPNTAVITAGTGILATNGGSLSGTTLSVGSHAWNLISSTPTTLAGYGIGDALAKSTALTAGTGIGVTNGGTLSGGVTVSLASVTTGTTVGGASSAVTICYNAYGQITASSSVAITAVSINSIPNTTAITAGTGISITNGGTIANGTTISIANTTVTGSGAAVGSSTSIPVITYNAQGQLTTVTTATVTPSTIGALPNTATLGVGTGLGITNSGSLSGTTISLTGTIGVGASLAATNSGSLNGTTISINNSITSTVIGATSVVPILGINAQGLITSVSSASISTGSNMVGSAGITVVSGTTIALTNSITAASNIGDSTHIPVLSYNAQGMLTAVSTALIGGSTYTQTFNATTDWASASGSFSITVAQSNHLKGTWPFVQVVSNSSAPFIVTTPDQISIDGSGNITVSVPGSPDCRFTGVVLVK